MHLLDYLARAHKVSTHVARRSFTAAAAVLLTLGMAACSGNTDATSGSADAGTNAGKTSGKDGGNKDNTIRFALDWTPNTNHTGLYVAQQKGYFKDAGIDVEILPYNTADPDDLINSGNAEFGISTQSSSTKAKAGGADIVSVMSVLQSPGTGIAVKADSNITRPSQLDGKTYAGFGDSTSDETLKKIIKSDGGKGEFESVNANTAAYDAVYSGKADFTISFMAWEGIEAQHRGEDMRYFYYSDYGFPNSYGILIDGNPDWIKSHPDLAKAFTRALERGYQDAVDNPAEGAQLLIDANPGAFPDEAMVKESQEMLSKKYMKDSEGKFGRQTLETWQKYGEFLFDSGLLKDAQGNALATKPNWNEYFTNDLLN